MFSSSTLLTLGLTALLCGIIMFYCKRKFAEYEQRLELMSDLISTMVTQLNQIPPSVYDNSGLLQPSENIQHSIIEENTEDNDNGDDNGSEYGNEDNEISLNDNRIIVNLVANTDAQFDADNEANNIEELDDDAWDSEEEDDEEDNEEDNNKKLTINDPDFDVVIESIDLSQAPNDITTVANNIAETVIENVVSSAMTLSNGDTKVIETPSIDVDYSKMQVAMLKKMVAERKLAQGVSKMKKQDLIDVLMKQ